MCDCFVIGTSHSIYPDPDCPTHGRAAQETSVRIDALESRVAELTALVERLIELVHYSAGTGQ